MSLRGGPAAGGYALSELGKSMRPECNGTVRDWISGNGANFVGRIKKEPPTEDISSIGGCYHLLNMIKKMHDDKPQLLSPLNA